MRAFSWWLQPQGEPHGCLQTWKERHALDYYFRVRGVRYRGVISEARTKKQAEQAESKSKQEIFEGRFGLANSGTMKLAKFIDEIYMPWAIANKRSWKGDQYYSEVLKDYFKGKSLCEITPLLVEKFKHERIKTPTKYGRARAEASVNREFEMLSRVLNLAIDFKNAESNPCSRVRKFKLDNERYRYLLPEEEPLLLSVMEGKRAHLRPLVVVALGLGLRKREQLTLQRGQVDFSRNVVIAARTKGRKNREIPIDVLNPEVREILRRACHEKIRRITSLLILIRISRSMTSSVPFTPLAALPGLRTFGGTIYEPPSARVWHWLAMRH